MKRNLTYLILLFLFLTPCYTLNSQEKTEVKTLTSAEIPLVTTACKNFETALQVKDFGNADQFFNEAISVIEESKSIIGVNNLRNIVEEELTAVGNYKKALFYLIEIKICSDKIGFLKGSSDVLNALGVIYWHQGDNQKALKYYQENLELLKKLNNAADFAALYNNLGLVYRKMNQTEKALACYDKALQYGIESKEPYAQANAYNNIGVIYQYKLQFPMALEFYKKSLAIRNQFGDSVGISISKGNVGVIYMQENKLDSAEMYLLDAYGISKRAEDLEGIVELSENLSTLYEGKNNPELALQYYKEYISVRDTLNNQASQREIIQKEMQYQFDKEEQKNALKAENEKSRQRLYTYMVLFVLIIVLFFSFLLNKRFNLTKKQKEIIENQKHLVEEKQKEITDSIHYAKRIQSTLLAHSDFLNTNLPEHFVLFKPKDIVSGDFYWASLPSSKTESDDTFYLAVCDSTGHGVPGAFMSLLNISFLNEAINEKLISNPNEVFDHVRERLISNVSQEGGQDGMDGILIKLNKHNLQFSYAAANNAPLLIHNGALSELTYDKMPVGQGEKKQKFSLFTGQLQKGDVLYLYTDGYADQFGGPKGKKFKYKQLNELLLQIHAKPLAEQKEILAAKFSEWKGDLEQVDDVCIIGIRA